MNSKLVLTLSQEECIIFPAVDIETNLLKEHWMNQIEKKNGNH